MTSRRLAALLALGFALASIACGAQAPSPSASPAPTPTPTPTYPAPALVQVENSVDSRPHTGLQKADMVFEYLTEGGITRFTAVFTKPGGTEKIGPDRSARLVTVRLLRAYGGVLFYSGASDKVLGTIWDAKIPNFDDRSDGGRYFSRDPGRVAPHNLYTTGDQVASAVQKSGATVTYRLPARGEPAGAGDAQVAKLAFDQTPEHPVTWTYDSGARTYQYRTDSGVEVDSANGGKPLAASSVVLLQVAHQGAGYTEDVNGQEGIDFALQGTGPADIYTRGQHFKATWDLSDPARPLRLLGADGQDFTLPDGLAWIHLVDPGTAVKTG